MKKGNSFKKSMKVFFIALLTFVTTLLNVVAVSAPATIVTGNTHDLGEYIDGMSFGIKELQGGGIAYCLDSNKKTPLNTTLHLYGEQDAGLAYIMKNGAPNQSITGNLDYDYYITQAAIWWYLDDTTGSGNLASTFKTTGEDPHQLRPYIESLVRAAKNARSTGYVTPKVSLQSTNTTLSLSSDKKYYETGTIQIVGSSLVGNVTVQLSTSLANAEVISLKTNQAQTTYEVGDSFKVRVPVGSVKDFKNTITLEAKATGVVDKAYEYRPDDPTVQNMMPVVLYSEEIPVSTTETFSLNTTKVSIIKIDATTKKPLAGATLVLKDSEGKVITSWKSTTNAHTIQNLKMGTYTIEETEGVSGYQKLDEPVTFTITDDNRNITVYVSNKKVSKYVEIQKIDEDTKAPLAGAKMIITDSDGNVIATFVTTTEPYLLENLEDGTYYIEEIEAPEGYQKSDKKYEFTISDKTPTAKITFTNKEAEIIQEVPVPNTGNHTQMGLTIMGFIFMISSVGIVMYQGRRRCA